MTQKKQIQGKHQSERWNYLMPGNGFTRLPLSLSLDISVSISGEAVGEWEGLGGGRSKPSLCVASAAKNNNQRAASVVVTDYFSQVLFPTVEWKDELAANLLKHFKVLFFFIFFLSTTTRSPKLFEDQFANHTRGMGDGGLGGGLLLRPAERLSLDVNVHLFLYFCICQPLVNTCRYWTFFPFSFFHMSQAGVCMVGQPIWPWQLLIHQPGFHHP